MTERWSFHYIALQTASSLGFYLKSEIDKSIREHGTLFATNLEQVPCSPGFSFQTGGEGVGQVTGLRHSPPFSVFTLPLEIPSLVF